MQNILALRDRLEAFPQWVLQALMRVAIFWIFWRSGMLKAANMEQTVSLFRDEYLTAEGKEPIPAFLQNLLAVSSWPAEAMAWLATAVELGAPVFILVGLATRLAALPLIGMTLFIQFFVYWRDYPSHLLWLAILVFIVVRGPGPASLDALLAPRILRRA
ncbi:MAG: DoxX family protein [Alphaproteobacteria bacterium]|nr:DoxX family protein [Alphaproteobacteria bacterium]